MVCLDDTDQKIDAAANKHYATDEDGCIQMKEATNDVQSD
jgi:hypothetical protein